MKLAKRTSTTRLASYITVAGFFVLSLFLLFGGAGKSAHADIQGGRLITVHDRGSELAFITDKSTLREAFADASITIDPKDAVEPSLDEKLVASDYQVNIYRARPVTVVDGLTRTKVVTPYQSAERIAKDANITLYPEDIATLNRSNDIVSDGAGLQLTIDRAALVSVDLYGKVTQLRTQGETIAEFLKEKGMTLGKNDRASAALTAAIGNGSSFRIWREGRQTITVDEAVAFETQQIKDADRAVGYREVQTPGKDGVRTATYEITVQNGIEVARTLIASVTIEEPTKQVEIVGSKPNELPYAGGGTKTEWLAASNIPQESWGYADYMVGRESGWNPNAKNPTSGACGLAQALPCSKVGANWMNPVVSLNWMNNYVNGRYGGWAGAYAFWQANHWY